MMRFRERLKTSSIIEVTNMTIEVNDGNAYSFMGAGRRALIKMGRDSEIDTFLQEMTSGDYNHLIQTFLKWFPDAEIQTS